MWTGTETQAPTGLEPQPGRLSGTQRPQAGWDLPSSQASPSVNGGSFLAYTGPVVQAGPEWAAQRQSLLLWAQPKVQDESNSGVLAPSPA